MILGIFFSNLPFLDFNSITIFNFSLVQGYSTVTDFGAFLEVILLYLFSFCWIFFFFLLFCLFVPLKGYFLPPFV